MKFLFFQLFKVWKNNKKWLLDCWRLVGETPMSGSTFLKPIIVCGYGFYFGNLREPVIGRNFSLFWNFLILLNGDLDYVMIMFIVVSSMDVVRSLRELHRCVREKWRDLRDPGDRPTNVRASLEQIFIWLGLL